MYDPNQRFRSPLLFALNGGAHGTSVVGRALGGGVDTVEDRQEWR